MLQLTQPGILSSLALGRLNPDQAGRLLDLIHHESGFEYLAPRMEEVLSKGRHEDVEDVLQHMELAADVSQAEACRG